MDANSEKSRKRNREKRKEIYGFEDRGRGKTLEIIDLTDETVSQCNASPIQVYKEFFTPESKCLLCGNVVSDTQAHYSEHILNIEKEERLQQQDQDLALQLEQNANAFDRNSGTIKETSTDQDELIAKILQDQYNNETAHLGSPEKEMAMVEETRGKICGILPLIATRFYLDEIKWIDRACSSYLLMCGECDFYYQNFDVAAASMNNSQQDSELHYGCGYRNIMSFSSHLVKRSSFSSHLVKRSSFSSSSAQVLDEDSPYKKVLFRNSKIIPNIVSMQRCITECWEKGFDPEGAAQMGGNIINTHAWIGSGEISSLLRSYGVRLNSQAFVREQKSRLFDFVWNYFSDFDGIVHEISKEKLISVPDPRNRYYHKLVCCGRPPIYLQHKGHSRLIVGICKRNRDGQRIKDMNGSYLIVLDPIQNGVNLEAELLNLSSHTKWKSMLKRGEHTLRQEAYELCYLEEDGGEHEECKKDCHVHSPYWKNKMKQEQNEATSKFLLPMLMAADEIERSKVLNLRSPNIYGKFVKYIRF